MGADEHRRAVADAGPFIHLNKMAHLSLLSIFDEIHVTSVVWAEATMSSRVEARRLVALAQLREHQWRVTILQVLFLTQRCRRYIWANKHPSSSGANWELHTFLQTRYPPRPLSCSDSSQLAHLGSSHELVRTVCLM